MKLILSLFLFFFFVFSSSYAQKQELNWYLKSHSKDKIFGTSSSEALELLKNKKSKQVIVAVIDSGVDTDHEDLKEVIWINEDEIPNNNKDDDQNGYIDDVHGWSFLGGKIEDINYESSELSRMYHHFNKSYSNQFEGSDRHQEYLKIKKEFLKEQKKMEAQIEQITTISSYVERVKKSLGSFTKKNNKKYDPLNKEDESIRRKMKLILLLVKASELEKQIKNASEQLLQSYELNNKSTDSIRRAIVGDNPEDISEKFYGCNRYKGPSAFHGTHVSGIIAASKNNNLGIEGIADNVKIMVLRAVPNGDERDKDIANSIIYAVDNGAKIINMSFGKYYSPHKKIVDNAIRYAASNDVLLIHAAGNESKNKDIETSYPSRILNDGSISKNWIEVGASSSSKRGKKIIANFSNYGLKTVDFFAPGVDVYSTVPDNKYADASGTSMACPATAGVAAIIRSYFPELSASEVRDVLMKTVEITRKKVRVPGTMKKVRVKEICISGGFLSAENAIHYLLHN